MSERLRLVREPEVRRKTDPVNWSGRRKGKQGLTPPAKRPSTGAVPGFSTPVDLTKVKVSVVRDQIPFEVRAGRRHLPPSSLENDLSRNHPSSSSAYCIVSSDAVAGRDQVTQADGVGSVEEWIRAVLGGRELEGAPTSSPLRSADRTSRLLPRLIRYDCFRPRAPPLGSPLYTAHAYGGDSKVERALRSLPSCLITSTTLLSIQCSSPLPTSPSSARSSPLDSLAPRPVRPRSRAILTMFSSPRTVGSPPLPVGPPVASIHR
jgi:hypothetical protein